MAPAVVAQPSAEEVTTVRITRTVRTAGLCTSGAPCRWFASPEATERYMGGTTCAACVTCVKGTTTCMGAPRAA
eukprot:CAMPEP_0115216074 /NCGR_PEP_ID=MMETSP0270-20121206/25151_1 /TAXON_ID=71861 /ORGANISM="Scrippsiella trochoidea, Strain CCMP3099" /LENGTH=73 /DNA_ID=CAMNT_0002629901 /DNA_START=60 /DNA_END=278 /DNA_ORIENTATION=-